MPEMSPLETLESRIENRQAVVAVVGLGYVGLPLVDAFFRAGFQTIGYDVDQEKIDKLNRGESYIGHIPSEQLQQWLTAKAFEATTETARLVDADAILVCVPTPLTESRDPDLSYVVSTFQAIAKISMFGEAESLFERLFTMSNQEEKNNFIEFNHLVIGDFES